MHGFKLTGYISIPRNHPDYEKLLSHFREAQSALSSELKRAIERTLDARSVVVDLKITEGSIIIESLVYFVLSTGALGSSISLFVYLNDALKAVFGETIAQHLGNFTLGTQRGIPIWYPFASPFTVFAAPLDPTTTQIPFQPQAPHSPRILRGLILGGSALILFLFSFLYVTTQKLDERLKSVEETLRKTETLPQTHK